MQLNAPLNNPHDDSKVMWIEVTDPAHPLYKKSFEIVSVVRPPRNPGFVVVRYKGPMLLRIPLPSTELGVNPSMPHPTRLSMEAIQDFIGLGEQCGILCQNPCEEFGSSCQKRKKNGSSSRCQ